MNGATKEFSENKERITSKIILHFLRHGAKVKGDIPDQETPLSEVGRIQSRQKAELDDISQSVAFGSPRIRTQETAGFVMGGKFDSITGTETLDELRDKLNKGSRFGNKIRIDERLDIHEPETDEYDDRFYGAADDDKFLKFLFEESDEVAKELGDTRADTYSRMASQIAGIIQKYLAIAPRWDRLAQDSGKPYNDTLERFFSTHGGVGESFLGKAIELTRGAGIRNQFAQALNMMGFGSLEGFEVEIINSGSQNQEVHVLYHKEAGENPGFDFDEKLSTDILQDIQTLR